MPRATIQATVPASAVWEVLADARLLPGWVVGASTARGVEGSWPQVGSTMHHTQAGVLQDSTSVLASEPCRLLELEVRARPLVVARVTIEITDRGEHCDVSMEEVPTGGLAALIPTPLSAPAIRVRNRLALRRLERLASIGPPDRD